MTRVLVADFGIIQKNLANAVVAFYLTDSAGVNTGVLANIYQDSSTAATQSNPQTLDADGMLSQDCYIDAQVMGSISGISALTQRGIKKIKDNPLEFSMPVTSSNWAKQAGEDLYTDLASVNAAVEEVQDILEDVGFIAVAADLNGANHIGTVAGIAAAIATDAANITPINTVATDLSGANTIGTVATAIANVNTVAGDHIAIGVVAGDHTPIGVVAADHAVIVTAAGDHTAINTVAGDHTAIATIITNLTALLAVAADIVNIDIVAAAITSINTCATNIASIVAAAIGTESYKQKSADYNILVADYVVELTAGSHTFTFPSFVTAGAGKPFVIKNSGAGTLTWGTTAAQTVDGATSGTLAQYGALTIYSNGTNAIISA
jgi:hypothetical protein